MIDGIRDFFNQFIATDNTAFVMFHSMLSLGFGAICYYSIKHLRVN